ncbi:MAG: phytoene/squalene synthase family protein [Parerythrobacter sp.]
MAPPRKITPRPLVPSAIVRATESKAGGGRKRRVLVEESRRMIADGSKSFAAASRLFDKPTRERVWMLYAWCRRCDDIADGQMLGGELGIADGGEDTAPDAAAVETRVKAIRVLTRRALEGQPTADIAFDAFGKVAQECGLTMQMAEDVIGGFELDAAGWRPRTEADLARYCYHVAGAVGVMMAQIMGVPKDDADTLDRACDLGFAFQLANIARDLDEDDRGGRCYLPVEWMVEQDIEPGQLMKPHHRWEVAEMAEQLVLKMERHTAAAKLGAARLPFRRRWAILAAANIYGEIGQEVRRRGRAAWDSRVVISKAQKAQLVAQAFVEAVRNNPVPPEKMPKWKRGDIVLDIRMSQPIPAAEAYTALPDDDL